jgi:hypothetical protein
MKERRAERMETGGDERRTGMRGGQGRGRRDSEKWGLRERKKNCNFVGEKIVEDKRDR